MADLDERLREIARAAEPSIRLAGPEAVRARGRRRTIRTRAVTAVSAVLAAVALAIGSWQLLPGDDPTRTLPAGPPPSGRTESPAPDIAVEALLRPTALPFDAAARWKTVRTTDRLDSPLLDLEAGCRLTGLDGDAHPLPAAQRARVFQGRQAKETARHTINAYRTERDAVRVFNSLQEVLRTRCGLVRVGRPFSADYPGSVRKPTVRVYGSESDGSGGDRQVSLMRSGTEVAIVQVDGLGVFGASYVDMVATHCMSLSLWRLHPDMTPPPPQYKSNPEGAEQRC
ncbi:hypothetical protein [Streptomyces sp. SAJ15]|uniref:hypothetical protein n=1 Tax=Streptomyces sp. SAJ15 TaxID=2011095 RepID=UPI001642D3A1|nr:hypothetical protein [Streptomyces sp. SAJ15]